MDYISCPSIFLSSQRHYEQQDFLPASQPDASVGHARDCHGGHGQRTGRRQVTGWQYFNSTSKLQYNPVLH